LYRGFLKVFKFAKIDIVIPYGTITSGVLANVSKKRIVFKRIERQFIHKTCTILHPGIPRDKSYKEMFP